MNLIKRLLTPKKKRLICPKCGSALIVNDNGSGYKCTSSERCPVLFIGFNCV